VYFHPVCLSEGTDSIPYQSYLGVSCFLPEIPLLMKSRGFYYIFAQMTEVTRSA
jgi:hypothetical protein